MTSLLAAMAGICFALALPAPISAAAGMGSRLFDRALVAIDAVLVPLRRPQPAYSGDRRQRLALSLFGALVAGAVAWLIGGGALAGVASIAGAALMPRLVQWRSRRYRAQVDAGASAAARSIADALAAGRSTRGSFAFAAAALDGPIRAEIERVAVEIELGLPTGDALEQLRRRARSVRIDLIVAAIVLQRTSGGDLAALLRALAATITGDERLRDEARAASAQARFTSTVVLAMPAGVLLLGELASPGLISSISSSAAAVALLALAAVMQLIGGLTIRRLARVDR